MIPDWVIINLYNDRRNETHNRQSPEPEIGPKDLVGKTIIGYRDLKTQKENPEEIRVFDFSDGSSLVTGCEGLHDDSCMHCFLVDSKGVDRYASDRYLFDPSFEKYRNRSYRRG